jgi:TolB-like protein
LKIKYQVSSLTPSFRSNELRNNEMKFLKNTMRAIPCSFMVFFLTVGLVFSFLYFTKTASGADDQKELNAAVQDLKDNLNVQIGAKPMRLAVLAFLSTKSDKHEKFTEFGDYLSENIISALSKETKKVKLFERKRLDLILGENSLSLSGLINADQAKRIGELAPVDAVLSGTFTKLANYVEINSRVVDVVTGEILLTYSAKVILTNDLKSLFGDRQIKQEEEDVCVQYEKRINHLLSDLSTPEKVRALVKEAVKIPFEGKCARIHYSVMRSFTGYQIDNPEYENFLIQTIDAILFPSGDFRAGEAMRFITRNNRDDRRWELCVRIIKESTARHISSLLQPFVNYDYQPEELPTIYKRIDHYFLLLKNNEIGLPKPISFNSGFQEMLSAADGRSTAGHAVSLYCYNKYKDDLVYDNEVIKELYGYLTRVYLDEVNEKQKLKVLHSLSEHFNNRETDEKLAEDLFEFVFRFVRTEDMPKDPQGEAKVPLTHLTLFVEKCRPLFCKTIGFTKYPSQKEERINFCIDHNIRCPNVIPSAEDCVKQLSSKNWNDRVQAVKLLSRMGAGARIAESEVIKSLERDSLENEREVAEVHKYAAIILGNIKSTNPKAIELLVQSLGSLEYMVPQMALKSLVEIGKPAIPYLIKGLDNQQGSIQYKCAKALGQMGPAAKSAKPALQKLLRSANRDLVIVAKESLEEIGN